MATDTDTTDDEKAAARRRRAIKAAATRVKNAEARAKQERKDRKSALEDERSKLQALLPTLFADYEKALDAANRAKPADLKHRFNVADRLQARCIGTTRRIRVIENQLQNGTW